MTPMASKLPIALIALIALGSSRVLGAESPTGRVRQGSVYPDAAWRTCKPDQVALSPAKLNALRRLVGGRGCVVRHGWLAYHWGGPAKSADIASAAKPILTTLLILAVQEKRLRGVDDRVADFEPRLKALNGGKDQDITWRHLASQTSGYGLTEPPGKAYAYNDYALALYYDVLTRKVFRSEGTRLLKTRLADALQFQDRYTFEAFGPKDRPGRLAVSVRDWARFGLLMLRGGKWKDKQIVRPNLLKLMLSSPVAADTPLTAGRDVAMLPGQRSLGGGKNITRVGPGYYSFNWWLNGKNRQGKRLYVDAPPDTYVACGHGGMRMLWVIPSLDLVIAWNEAQVEDHDASPGNPHTKCNRAARLIREAVLDRPAKKRQALP
jgi:CubicO group peptidase (beta-lactamase class C family)